MVIREEVNGRFYYDMDATSVEMVRAATPSPLPRSQSGSTQTESQPTPFTLHTWVQRVNAERVSHVIYPVVSILQQPASSRAKNVTFSLPEEILTDEALPLTLVIRPMTPLDESPSS